MRWTYKEPSYGDMIRVAVGTIYHFGIYVSDSEVIQFGLPPSRRSNLSDSSVEVISSDIDGFLAGGFLEVCEFDKKEKKKNRTPEQTVKYARSKLGTRGYNILYNNCEHFANECVSGVQICRQAQDIRELFKNMPIVDVYIAAMPEGDCDFEISCKARAEEIAAVSNEKVRREKTYVWKLLCYALERSFGIRGNDIGFVKEEYGGWSVGNVQLSLSHSEGALAVAVSRAPVGIDIERIRAPRVDKVAEYIMSDRELKSFSAVPESEREERLIEIWTAKEAIFKSKHSRDFLPKSRDTLSEVFRTEKITVGNERYAWSVATSTPEKIRIFSDIDLTKK